MAEGGGLEEPREENDEDDEEEPRVPYGPVEYHRRLNVELVLLELRDELHPQWFELFQAIGVDRDKLVDMRDRYRKDPKVCMHEAVRLWFSLNKPRPSWELLVRALRYTLLETGHADRVEILYCKPPTRNPFNRPDPRVVQEEDIDDIYGPKNAKGMTFPNLLMEVTDQFIDGHPSTYGVVFHINSLVCPDGSPFIEPGLIRCRSSLDGVLIPLVLHSFISRLDVDMLVYLIEVFKKTEQLMPHVNAFLSSRTFGEPYVRRIRNLRRNFLIRCIYRGRASELNFKMALKLKSLLKELFEFEAYPYLLQYIGWSSSPLSLCYMAPFPCMHRVRDALKPLPLKLREAHVKRVIIEIGSAIFPYT